MTTGVQRFVLTADQTSAATKLVNSWRGLGQLDPRIQRQDIHITGTWGSGTATLQYSIDGGTNWVACPVDKEANIVSLTSDGIMTIKQRFPLLSINLTGSTNPSLTVQVV